MEVAVGHVENERQAWGLDAAALGFLRGFTTCLDESRGRKSDLIAWELLCEQFLNLPTHLFFRPRLSTYGQLGWDCGGYCCTG